MAFCSEKQLNLHKIQWKTPKGKNYYVVVTRANTLMLLEMLHSAIEITLYSIPRIVQGNGGDIEHS